MENATKNNDTVDILIRALEKIDDEIKSAIETIEVMANPETLKGIEEGLQDIKEGRVYTLVVSWKSWLLYTISYII